MAGQSITFDFLTTGADRTASGFRKVGDNTVLAARGAKVLSDAIEKLGKKEDRTAAESKLLASALRQTGDAEDRVAARAVVADAAVRRLDDAMQDSNKHSGELSKTLSGLKLNPGLVGPLLALAPAIATLGGVGAGAAAGLGGAFIAGGAALAAFGAVAKPVLTDAKKAADAVGKAQDAYNTAISQGVAPSKAFKAEQLAIAKAYAGMSPAQIALSKQLGDMASAWDKVKAAQTPVIAGALQPWLKSVTALTGQLGPIIAKIAPVIASLGAQFGALVGSSAFRQFRDFIGSTGSAAVSAGGSTIIDLVKSFMILLPKFDPLIREAVGWISRLGPAVLTWSSSKKASDDIQKFLQWFSQNGPVVGGLIKNIGGALAALAPGLASGGTAELQALSAFFGFVAKLPPGLAKPLAEVAGALLILNKLGVVSVGVKLLGLGGAGGAASAAGAAAGGAAAGGLWAKILPGARLVGGALVVSLIIDQVLENKKNPKVLGNTNPNSPWNSFTSNESLGGKAINAIAALFHHATVSIMADFAAQGKAASSAMTDVAALTQAITHNGNASGEAHAARAALITDMTKAGVNAATAQTDVMNYSNAVQANGAKSAQAAAARGKLTSDILAASKNAAQGKTDLANYTGAVQANGTKSDGARSARARLITDLVNSGLSAKTAAGLVDGLGRSIGRLPKSATVKIITEASGTGQIAITGTGWALGQGNIRFHAARGAYIDRGTGPTADDVLIRASKGELVVPTHMVRAGAVDHLRGRIPGFASGGFVGLENQFAAMVPSAGSIAGGDAGQAVRTGVAKAMAAAKALVAAKALAAHPPQPFGPMGDSGARSGSAAVAQAYARSLLSQYHWGQDQMGPLIRLWNQESGWNAYAVNPSSGAYGIPQSLGHGHPYNLGDYKNQIIWGLNYIRGRYGSPSAAWAHEVANNWYAKGGLVPGFASGGVAGQGAAYLKAWRSRHGGGFGAAWGPVAVNEQIAEMAAAARRAKTLAGASGLTAGQHRYWTATAADETRRLGVLRKELGVERAWRGQLGASDVTLGREIAAAGKLPHLAGAVKGWKSQIGRQKATIAGISRMLGYSDAHLDAHRPGPKVTPPGVPGSIPHTGAYTDSTADLIRQLFASLASNSRVVTLDSGGWLMPGVQAVANRTGRPEQVLPPGRGGGYGGGTLVLQNHGVIGSQAELENWLVRSIDDLKRKRRI